MCTWHRAALFGQIVNGEMQLSPLGEMVEQEWFRSNQMRCEIELHIDEFVIIPKRIHAIVRLVGGGRMPSAR
jgi:putative transposase